MALVLDYTVSIPCTCQSIIFTDTTGAYDAGSNAGGWGAPNIANGDVTIATLKITFPDTTEQTISVLTEVNAGIGFEKTIAITDLEGFSTDSLFPAGKYTFEFKVTTDSVTYYSTEVEMFSWCSYSECYKNLLIGYTGSDCCDGCQDAAKEKITKVAVLLESLKAAADCLDEARFNSISAKLQTLCKTTSDCGC